MKKFRCIASGRIEGEVGRGIVMKKKSVYTSISFTFSAKRFSDAMIRAERIAKKMLVFESLKVSQL